MSPTSRIDVDLRALDHNLAAWRRLLGETVRIGAVVKADAYGLGAEPIARRLVAGGVDLLAVYSPDQARELIESGLDAELLVLMPVERLDPDGPLGHAARAGRLHLTLHGPRQMRWLEKIGRRLNRPINVHIELDTGMSRGGLPPDDATDLFTDIARRRFLRLSGVFSHPSSAGCDPETTELQHQRFEAVLDHNADRLDPGATTLHFSNTQAALRDRRFHKHMIRTGLGLYGYGARGLSGRPALPQRPRLRPVLRWTSRIVHVNHVPAHQPVGYRGTWVTERPSRLGLIPVGHAEGYPVGLSNRGVVRVGPGLHPAPVRGEVNMDQLIIDLTDLPESEAGVDSEVELIAADPEAPNALERLAELGGSSCYEMLCRLAPRLPRRYIGRERATEAAAEIAVPGVRRLRPLGPARRSQGLGA